MAELKPRELGRTAERQRVNAQIDEYPTSPYAERVTLEGGVEAEVDWGLLLDAQFLLHEVNLSRRPWSSDYELRDKVKTARDALADVINGLRQAREQIGRENRAKGLALPEIAASNVEPEPESAPDELAVEPDSAAELPAETPDGPVVVRAPGVDRVGIDRPWWQRNAGRAVRFD